MSTTRILSRSVATLLALAPFALHAATQTIIAAGDPTDGSPGANPAWGVPANWSGPNGAVLPGVNDIAAINSDDFFRAGVDIRATDFTGATPNFTEVQGLSFIGSTFQEVDLENSSPDNNMTLALNGGGGVVPLIQTGAYAVQILGVGLGAVVPTTKTLTLQLKGNGDFNVGDGGLTISAVIAQSGGNFGFNKTGSGTLILSGATANTYAGTTTISEGLVIANKPTGINAIGGNLVINAGATFMYQANSVGNQIANGATITLNGGTFGDNAPGQPTNPGAPETVTSVIVNSGNFSTGRAAFVTSGLFSAAGGTTLVHRGGSLTVGSFSLGNGGIVNLDGGSTTAGAESKLTVGAGGVTLSGGTINFVSGQSGVSNTSVGGILTLGGNLTSTGTNIFLHQNVGTMTVHKANVELGTATRTFNVTGSLTLGALGAAVIVNGGSNATGSIIKTGPGTLSMFGTNTLVGAVAINGGTLALSGSMSTLSPVTIANGAKFMATGTVPAAVTANGGSTLQTGDANGVGNISVNSLKLGVVAGDTETLNMSSTSGIIVTASGGLTVLGGAQTVTINIGGAVPGVGLYTLIDYTGVFGAGINAFKLGTLPSPRLAAALTLNSTNTTINLNVTGFDFPVWKGALSTEWSTTTLGNPKNWVLNSNNATITDYLLGDAVTFNDIATSTTVDVSVEDVAPSSMTFANVNKDYTLIGSRSITGSGNFVKNGGGKVTINSSNSFSGTVSMNAGTVSVATLDDAGFVSPLGAGTSFSFNGGTLEYTGAGGGTNRAISLNVNGGKVKTDTTLNLSGAITGSGALTKLGNGTLVLTGANNYGGTTISAGTLQVGNGGAGGALGTGPVTNNTALVFNRSDNGLIVTGAIGGTGTVTQSGPGTTTLGGTTANTYAGLTTVSAGTLLAGKTAGVNAIPGDLVVEAGAAFAYAGNNISNQIADTATITLNGGMFGDPVSGGTGPTNPGATDTVANVNVNAGGIFNSGRNDTLAPFTITGVLNINGGAVLAQRGGAISAGTVNFSSGSLALDGGSGTAGQESKLIVGGGGLTLTNNAISLNAGPSNFAANSVGSIVTLNGNVTSTGTSGFVRLNPGLSNAKIDLGGGVRTFNVTGALNIGDSSSTISVTNGGINKTGTGTLNVSGPVALSSLNVGAGVMSLTPHLGGPAGIYAIDTSALSFAGSAKLDLSNNAMVVRGGNYATVYGQLFSGFNNGAWDGPGINSSAAATDPNGRTALAIINNADAGFTDFAGVTGLTGNEVILRYTYYGDADLSGTVTQDDYFLFLTGFTGAASASWLFGDFDYSGTVTQDDFFLFLETFNNQGGALRDPVLAEELNTLGQQFGTDSGIDGLAPVAGGAGDAVGSAAARAVVPEPGSAGLVAVGALGLLARRRRR